MTGHQDLVYVTTPALIRGAVYHRDPGLERDRPRSACGLILLEEAAGWDEDFAREGLDARPCRHCYRGDHAR